MNRRLFVAGNWKMYGASLRNAALINDIVSSLQADIMIDIAVMPPFPYLESVAASLTGSPIQLGAQNLYLGQEGAFTGEVSGSMLQDVGCRYVLVGHSERRALLNESSSLVGQKVKAALDVGLSPILCVGETQAERLAERTEEVVAAQLQAVLEVIGARGFDLVTIAYEPVWAIGTGLTATPLQAEAVHAFIRAWLIKNQVAETQRIRILYGGSVKPDNARALFAMSNIDGGLIGGASLNAASFVAICQAAHDEALCVVS